MTSRARVTRHVSTLPYLLEWLGIDSQTKIKISVFTRQITY